MTEFLIGTQYITTPNFTVKVLKETPKTYYVETIDVDFTPKTGASGRFTHVFDIDEQEYFTSLYVGQKRRFWKGSGKEISGNTWIIL